MSTAAVRGVVRHLGLDAPPTDAALLTRYARHRDNAAFAELLRRHGPVVLGVCRRVLSDPHAAEDAFQAVFLVLARKADTVRPPGRVGGWLYGVAVRTARKAKVAAARRWRREMASAEASREREQRECLPESSQERAELRAVIDEELAKLPAKLRELVVLCDLGGKSRSEAAVELGWPEGTVAARLAKARKLLADRLTRRGMALPAAGLACLASEVAPALARSTLVAADAFGRGLASSVVSPTAQALAEGVLRAMTTGKMKLAAVLILVGGLLAGATAFRGHTAAGGPPADPAPTGQPRPAAGRPAEPKWTEHMVLTQSGWLAGSVAYSPDGKWLVVGGTGVVTAYDTTTHHRRWLTRVDGDAQHFAAVAFSADSKTIAATFADGVKFLEAATGKITGAIEEKGSKPTAVGFFPDRAPGADGVPPRKKLVFGDSRGYHVKDWIALPQAGGINLTLTRDGKPREDAHAVPLAVDPRGRSVILTSPIERETGKHGLWAWVAGNYDAGSPGNRILAGHKATVTAAAWSADGNTAVTGDAEGTVIVWDALTFKEKSRLRLAGRIAALAVTADGRWTAAAVATPPRGWPKSADREEVYVWKTASPPERQEPIWHSSYRTHKFDGLAGIAFAPDGKSLAAAFADFRYLTRTGELRGEVRTWTLGPAEPRPEPAAVGGWKEAAVLTHHAGPVDSVAFAPDGRWFVSGGTDGRVLKWDAATLKPEELGAMIPAGPVTAVAVSPDGYDESNPNYRLVAATRERVTGFFDPTKRQTVQMRPPFPGGRAVAFNPKFGCAAVSDGYTTTIRYLDEQTPTVTADPPADPSVVRPESAAVAWSPDGKTLAYTAPVRGGKQAIGLTATQRGSQPTILTGSEGSPLAVAWSPDGKLIAVGTGDGLVIVWEAATGKERSRAKVGGRGGLSTVRAVAFSPDGATVAAGVEYDEGKSPYRVILIDARTGRVGQHLMTFGSAIRSLAFSPDGRQLLAAHGIDRSQLKPLMTPDELKAAGGIVVFARDGADPPAVEGKQSAKPAVGGWVE